MTTPQSAAALAEEIKRFGRRKWYDMMDERVDALAALATDAAAQRTAAIPEGYKLVADSAYGQRYISLIDPVGKIIINAYEEGAPYWFNFLTALATPPSAQPPVALPAVVDAEAVPTAPLTHEQIAAAGLGLEYVHSVLRWAACGYVHTPERIAQLHTSYRIVDKLVNAAPASASEPEPPRALPGEASDELFDAVKDVIRQHRLSNWTREDDEGMPFPLVELLTPPGDKSIQCGADEIDYLVDAIFMDGAVLAALATPASLSGMSAEPAAAGEPNRLTKLATAFQNGPDDVDYCGTATEVASEGLPNELGFEQWYVDNAFDYVRDPIGSRDCSLQRKAWHGGIAALRAGQGDGETGVPAGFWLAPKEPDEEMIEAGKDERMECFKDTTLSVGAALMRIMNAARDSWLARHPQTPVHVDVEPAGWRAALEFYANGNHRMTLTNIPRRNGFDWDKKRQKLNDIGFRMVRESSNGSEDFFEDGSVAQAALNAVPTGASEGQTALVQAVLDLNRGWNAKETEALISERIDLCRRLANAAPMEPPERSATELEAWERFVRDFRGNSLVWQERVRDFVGGVNAERYRTLRHSLSNEASCSHTLMPHITDPVNSMLTYTPEGLDKVLDEISAQLAARQPSTDAEGGV